MADKSAHPSGIQSKTKEIIMETMARASRRTRLGVVLVAVAIAGSLAVWGAPANAQTASPEGGQSAKVEANKKVVLAFLKDVLARHHGDHAARYFTPDIQFHAGTVGTVTGRDNVAGLLTTVVTAIPDLHPALKDIFGEGNEVVVRLVVSGTQTGALLGIPATGRPVQWDAVDVYRLRNGKISEEWAAEDLTAILDDTGTYKAPWIP
jgi:predicted ester cyclase